MNKKDPKLIVLQFNESINKQDIENLSKLMTDNHIFIDRENTSLDTFSLMVYTLMLLITISSRSRSVNNKYNFIALP